MNEIYAVDPASTRNWKEFKTLLDKFGLQMGRFIAQYPEDWCDLVLKHYSNSGDIERKRIVELLRKSSDSALSIDLDFRRVLSWTENAVQQQHERRPFERIIASEDRPPTCVALEFVLYDPEGDLQDGRGGHIPMAVPEYARVAYPLLKMSNEIFLIDRFYRLRRSDGSRDISHENVLIRFLEIAEAAGKCERIVLIVDAKYVLEAGGGETQWTSDLEALLSRASSRKINIDYQFSDAMDHGRYLMSIKGGLQFDYGFDTKRPGDRARNHVHWLSKAELDHLVGKYVDRR